MEIDSGGFFFIILSIQSLDYDSVDRENHKWQTYSTAGNVGKVFKHPVVTKLLLIGLTEFS